MEMLVSDIFSNVTLTQGISNGALAPLGDHEQRPSLDSFAVILHNPSVTIY